MADGRERVTEFRVACMAYDTALECGPAKEELLKLRELASAIARDLDRDIRWRPIKDAPKDGTEVLLYEDNWSKTGFYVAGEGWWSASGTAMFPTHFAFLTPPEET